jgi:hypothetical protein
MTCEHATGLYGDLFATQHWMKYPPMCGTPICRQRYLLEIQNAIRMDDRRMTVVITFTNGEIRTVQLAICSFSTPGKFRSKL